MKGWPQEFGYKPPAKYIDLRRTLNLKDPNVPDSRLPEYAEVLGKQERTCQLQKITGRPKVKALTTPGQQSPGFASGAPQKATKNEMIETQPYPTSNF